MTASSVTGSRAARTLADRICLREGVRPSVTSATRFGQLGAWRSYRSRDRIRVPASAELAIALATERAAALSATAHFAPFVCKPPSQAIDPAPGLARRSGVGEHGLSGQTFPCRDAARLELTAAPSRWCDTLGRLREPWSIG
jgi:hypothetical protein